MPKNNEIFTLTLLWILIGIAGRLIPHLPNTTPLTSLCLLAGALFSCRRAISLMVIIIFTSNLLLSHFYGYPLFGWWTLFTYSGCIAMILLGTQLSPQPQFTRTIVFTMGVSLGYWLWTNFGVWLFTEMYPKTLEGLSACYTAALPFLRSALLGTIIWMLILLSMTHVIRWINQRPWQSLSKHILI